VLRVVCLRRHPDSPYANHDGYVPLGQLVNYIGGRSNGCTIWSPSDAEQIIPMLKDKPTTLYIYPESDDIDAVAQAKRWQYARFELLYPCGIGRAHSQPRNQNGLGSRPAVKSPVR
jgi:hypothetical protein